jgi:proton-translocating NADH-quinone oxidoreductase chain M
MLFEILIALLSSFFEQLNQIYRVLTKKTTMLVIAMLSLAYYKREDIIEYILRLKRYSDYLFDTTKNLCYNLFVLGDWHFSIILLLMLLPILGIIKLVFYGDKGDDKSNKLFIYIIGFKTFIVSIALSLYYYYDKLSPNSYNQLQSSLKTFDYDIEDHFFNLDGLSLLLVVLTTFLTFICLVSCSTIKNFKLFSIYFFAMEFFLLFVWLLWDLLYFFIFFEAVLIPMFLIIHSWGSRERRVRAAYLFFLYTLFGSVFMLLAILTLLSYTGSTDYFYIQNVNLPFDVEFWAWIGFFISFASKIPMVPFHIWLPEAHVEAPTSGSVILAGILLKLGGYGFLRYSIGLLPYASYYLSPVLYTIGIFSIIYASLTAIRQNDLKRIIAYASIAHMNLIVIGLFCFTQNAIAGGMLQMLSHGFVSSALFLGVGVLYDRYHSRLLKYYSGLTIVMPLFSIAFIFFNLANIAFPGTSSFIGEFLILVGVVQQDIIVCFLSAIGIILSGIYSMWLYNRVAFGNLKDYIKNFVDLNNIEFIVFSTLGICVLWMGLFPETFLSVMRGDIRELISITSHVMTTYKY